MFLKKGFKREDPKERETLSLSSSPPKASVLQIPAFEVGAVPCSPPKEEKKERSSRFRKDFFGNNKDRPSSTTIISFPREKEEEKSPATVEEKKAEHVLAASDGDLKASELQRTQRMTPSELPKTLRELRKCLKEDPQYLTRKNRDGQTPLHMLAAAGNCKLLKVLLDRLPDEEQLRQEDKNGWRALHWACSSGNIQCVELFVHPRRFLTTEALCVTADISARTRDHSLPLHLFLRHCSCSDPLPFQEDRFFDILKRLIYPHTDPGHTIRGVLHPLFFLNSGPI